MFKYSIIFLLIGLFCQLMDVNGIEVVSYNVAWILLMIWLVMAFIGFVATKVGLIK